MVKRIVVVVLIALFGLVFYKRNALMDLFRKDTRTVNTTEVRLLFREDPSLSLLLNELMATGVLQSEKDFVEYVEKNEIDTIRFAAGKYVILSQTQLGDLVNGFVKNEEGHGNAEVKVNVVFNRCKTIEDIGANISKCIVADSASIVEYILSSETLKKYQFAKEQVPALFLPDTYQMYFDTDAKSFVSYMAEEFKAFWTEERIAKMKAIGLQSQSQVVTLASIVYSEQSQMKEEWPIIAGLYLNRLEKGMRLESDPTFKFCWGNELDGVERLLNRHKEIDCPYNTYKYGGLPPGPIHVVPREVIDAVLNPAEVDYLFMCGKPGGKGHNFAVTNAQHERNAAEYRVWLKGYLAGK